MINLFALLNINLLLLIERSGNLWFFVLINKKNNVYLYNYY
jgi:hypothetical protein